ncbi:MAG: hypothetical protein ACYC4L_08490 [Chloroflexota bacterium]
MNPWLQYLTAFVVACHGSIYIPLLFMPEMYREWRGKSRLLGSALTGDRLRRLLIALHVGAGILIVASAAAIVFTAWVPGWWQPLAVAGATLGLAGFAVFWDGQTERLIKEGAIGAAVSLLLLLGAVAFPHAFG